MSYSKRTLVGEFSSMRQPGDKNSIALVSTLNSLVFGGQSNSLRLESNQNSIIVGDNKNSLIVGDNKNSITVGGNLNSIIVGAQEESFNLFSTNRVGWNAMYPTEELHIKKTIRGSSENSGAIRATKPLGLAEINMSVEIEIGSFAAEEAQPYKLGWIPISHVLQTPLPPRKMHLGGNGKWYYVIIWDPNKDKYAVADDSDTRVPIYDALLSEGKVDEPLVFKAVNKYTYFMELDGEIKHVVFPKVPIFHTLSPILTGYENKLKRPGFKQGEHEIGLTYMLNPTFIPVLFKDTLEYIAGDKNSEETVLLTKEKDGSDVNARTVMHYGESVIKSYLRTNRETTSKHRNVIQVNDLSLLGGVSHEGETGKYKYKDNVNYLTPKPLEVKGRDFLVTSSESLSPDVKTHGGVLYMAYPFVGIYPKREEGNNDLDDVEKADLVISFDVNAIHPPTPNNNVAYKSKLSGGDTNEYYNAASSGLIKASVSSVSASWEKTGDEGKVIKRVDFSSANHAIWMESSCSSTFTAIDSITLSERFSVYIVKEDEDDGKTFPILKYADGGTDRHLLAINNYDKDFSIEGIIEELSVVVSSPKAYVVKVRTSEATYRINVMSSSSFNGYGYINTEFENVPIMTIHKIDNNTSSIETFVGISSPPTPRKRAVTMLTPNNRRTVANVIAGDGKYLSNTGEEILVNNSSGFACTTIDTSFHLNKLLSFQESEGFLYQGITIPCLFPIPLPEITQADGTQINDSISLSEIAGRIARREYSASFKFEKKEAFTVDQAFLSNSCSPKNFGYRTYTFFITSAITESGTWEDLPTESKETLGYDIEKEGIYIADKSLATAEGALCVFNKQLYLGANSAYQSPNLDKLVLSLIGDYCLLNNYIICSSGKATYLFYMDKQAGIKELGKIPGNVACEPMSIMMSSVVPVKEDDRLSIYVASTEEGVIKIFEDNIEGYNQIFSHSLENGTSTITAIKANEGSTYTKNYLISSRLGISSEDVTMTEELSPLKVSSFDRTKLILKGDSSAYRLSQEEEEDKENPLTVVSHDFKPPHREGKEFNTSKIVLYFDNITELGVCDKVSLRTETNGNEVAHSTKDIDSSRIVFSLPKEKVTSFKYVITISRDEKPYTPTVDLTGVELIGFYTNKIEED